MTLGSRLVALLATALFPQGSPRAPCRLSDLGSRSKRRQSRRRRREEDRGENPQDYGCAVGAAGGQNEEWLRVQDQPDYDEIAISCPEFIFITDLSGVPFCDSNNNNRPITIADRPYFKTVVRMDTFTVGEFTTNRQKRNSFRVTLP